MVNPLQVKQEIVSLLFLFLYYFIITLVINPIRSICLNRVTEERPGWCSDPHLPPCAAYAFCILDLCVSLLSFGLKTFL
jgi:hypothetical protein